MNIHPLWYFCLFIRSSLILAIRYSKKNATKYLNILIAIIGIGFLHKALTGSNNEIQIEKVFWHSSRIFHSIFYILASIALYFQKININNIILLIDILFSISYRIITDQ